MSLAYGIACDYCHVYIVNDNGATNNVDKL